LNNQTATGLAGLGLLGIGAIDQFFVSKIQAWPGG
jgi:hypothetical protein